MENMNLSQRIKGVINEAHRKGVECAESAKKKLDFAVSIENGCVPPNYSNVFVMHYFAGVINYLINRSKCQ